MGGREMQHAVRMVLAVLVVASALAGAAPVAARPNVPEGTPERPGCQFIDGFARFHAALGDDLVGDCVSDATYDGDGNGRQDTTEGALFWNARTNQVSFHNGFQVWIDGPGGIGSNVTVAGLSDERTVRDPVTAPAIEVFEYAALAPWDLGDDWEYADLPPRMPTAKGPGCDTGRADALLGWTYVVFVNGDGRRAAIQMLHALPEHAAGSMRPQMEAAHAACDGGTVRTRRGEFTYTMRSEPFLKLGDDAGLEVIEVRIVESGQVRVSRSAWVRYGGLVSSLAILSDGDRNPDDERRELERLARLAHERVQAAAWELRP